MTRSENAAGAAPPAGERGSASRGQLAAGRDAVASTLSRPLASYTVVLVLTGLLSAIGLGMVLSSSNVLAFAKDGGSPFDIFFRQALFMVIGWFGFAVAVRMRMSTLKALALPGLCVSVVLLAAVLVPGVGAKINGARGWLVLGPVSIQPAEIAKLLFIVWASFHLGSRMRSGRWQDLLMPSVFVFGLVAGLIVIEPDLGMTTSTAVAFLCLLWFAGYPARHFAIIFGVGLGGFALFAATMAYRMARVKTFLNTFTGNFANPQGDAYQSYQGMLSLADGGLFGVGLGQSSAKWFYLPEATNDFIFAIIGEELGWIGATAVVCLYLVLGWVGIRIALRSVDPARRLLAGTITATIVLQAFINIGYVIGLLPVTGLQLPLISSGGTSAALTLFSLGLLANCARHEPDAISAIVNSSRTRRRRWFSLPDPEPYRPERVLRPNGVTGRGSDEGRRYGGPVRRRRDEAETEWDGPPAVRVPRDPRDRERGPRSRAPYESMPGPRRADERRGAAPMTGRTARAVRGREEAERVTRAAAQQRPGPRPIPLNRERRR